MGMEDRSLFDKSNLTFIALTATAIHYCLLAWKTAEFGITPEFGPGGGAQCKCDTIAVTHLVNIACIDGFRHLDTDFRSSSPEAQANEIVNIRSIIRWRIHRTDMDPAMAQRHNDQGSFDEVFLDYVPQELIAQPHNSLSGLSSFVAATEATMQLSAILSMGGSAIASSSQPVPCRDSNSNNITNITNITNINSIENTGLVNGSKIVEGTMSLGG